MSENVPPSDVETLKVRVDACLRQEEMCWKNFHNRRGIEWKLAIAIWTALGAFIATVLLKAEDRSTNGIAKVHSSVPRSSHWSVNGVMVVLGKADVLLDGMDNLSNRSSGSHSSWGLREWLIVLLTVIAAFLITAIHRCWMVYAHRANKKDRFTAIFWERCVQDLLVLPYCSELTKLLRESTNAAAPTEPSSPDASGPASGSGSTAPGCKLTSPCQGECICIPGRRLGGEPQTGLRGKCWAFVSGFISPTTIGESGRLEVLLTLTLCIVAFVAVLAKLHAIAGD
jgi:hypothetical protein